VLPQEMSQAMEPQRVQAGIAQDNLGYTSCCRVSSTYRLDIFSQGLKHNAPTVNY